MSERRPSSRSDAGRLRVLLAHDDTLGRFGLSRALADDDIEIVGEAHTLEQVVPLVARTRPQLLLVSTDLVEHAAYALLAALVRYPTTQALVVGRPSELPRARAACEAGAAGFVSTAVAPRHLPVLLKEAAAGTISLLPSPSLQAPTAEALTEREVAVLQGAARGLSNSAIGRELWLSPHTVKSHLHRIYAKLDVANRTEAALWALEHQIVGNEPGGSY